MAKTHLLIETQPGAAARAFDGSYIDIATAATMTMERAASIAKSRGRKAIAAGGFGRKWQNVLRAQVYPNNGKPSASAAVYLWHKIPYSGIFEEGGVIQGSPMLWIPIEKNVPKRLTGNRKVTPANWIKYVGPLVKVQGKRHPLLVRVPGLSQKDAAKKRRKSKFAPMFSGVSSRISGVDGLPVFFGVSSVDIRKKYSVIPAIKSVNAELPAMFASTLSRVTRGQ